MEEELNSPCTQEMAAFEQFMRYILTVDYDVVVFDTAPTGHTLRLLNLPFDYARQVEMMVSVSEASAKVKSDTHEQYRNVTDILQDKSRSVFALVMYPESTPIVESYRAMIDLKDAGIDTQLVVANMVLPDEVCINDFFQKPPPNATSLPKGNHREIRFACADLSAVSGRNSWNEYAGVGYSTFGFSIESPANVFPRSGNLFLK